jgi:polar amino acid transport system substrate-binding protein
MQRRPWIIGLLTAGGLFGCASTPPITPPGAAPQAPPEVRRLLAPSGVLRVAVYPGSPTSLVRAAPLDEMRGVSVDLGRELARRLGVPAEMRVFQRVAEVLDALETGRADFAITNATPARAEHVDFTPPLIGLELGYLALPGSAVTSIDAVDRPGIRIGVTQGSSSQGVLTRQYRQAVVVPTPSLDAARAMLQARQLDAFATNKAILFEMTDNLPGARVLDGRWGLEHLAIAVPKGRDAALPWLRAFTEAVRQDGPVQRAAERAGLRGTAAVEAR